MKDLAKSSSKNFALLGTVPKRKKALAKGFKSLQSLRPMRSCHKNPSLKPRTIVTEFKEMNAE